MVVYPYNTSVVHLCMHAIVINQANLSSKQRFDFVEDVK